MVRHKLFNVYFNFHWQLAILASFMKVYLPKIIEVKISRAFFVTVRKGAIIESIVGCN